MSQRLNTPHPVAKIVCASPMAIARKTGRAIPPRTRGRTIFPSYGQRLGECAPWSHLVLLALLGALFKGVYSVVLVRALRGSQGLGVYDDSSDLGGQEHRFGW